MSESFNLEEVEEQDARMGRIARAKYFFINAEKACPISFGMSKSKCPAVKKLLPPKNA
jgi:hypothetical protein